MLCSGNVIRTFYVWAYDAWAARQCPLCPLAAVQALPECPQVGALGWVLVPAGAAGVGALAYTTNCLGGNYKNNENMRDYLMIFDNVRYCLILLECSWGAALKAALTARAGMLVASL